ncbi:MAG TPA: hypothetical protein PLL77_01290 [Pyrinomonadaceae bacterium]|nr:hypothetical protein [Pyrinomonadaceae bacterium]
MKTCILTMTSLVLVAVFMFCVPASEAQVIGKVNVDLVRKKENFTHQAKVPILATEPKVGSNDSTLVYLGAWATVDCTNCSLSSEYELFAQAVKRAKDSIELYFDARFKNSKSCNIKMRKFQVKWDSTKKVRLKCGLELKITFPPQDKLPDSAHL